MLSRSLRDRLSDLIRQGSGSEKARPASPQLAPKQVDRTSNAHAPAHVDQTSNQLAPEQVDQASNPHAPGQVDRTSNSLAPGHVGQTSTQRASGHGHLSSNSLAPGPVDVWSNRLAPERAQVSLAPSQVGAVNRRSRSRAVAEQRILPIGIEEILPGGVITGPYGSLFIHERLYTDLGEEPGPVLERFDALCRLTAGPACPGTEKAAFPGT